MTTTEFNKELFPVKDRLFRYSYKLTQNIENARDLFQETLFKALKNKKSFKTGTNFVSWMYTIMKNQFINEYRRTKRIREVFKTNSPQGLSFEMTTENTGESTIMMKELSAMVDSLPQDLKVPFTMNYQGFRYQEIAEELNIPIGTVKSRIHFARKKLQGQIQLRYKERPRA